MTLLPLMQLPPSEVQRMERMLTRTTSFLGGMDFQIDDDVLNYTIRVAQEAVSVCPLLI